MRLGETGMLKGGDFGAHGEEHGRRLRRQLELGPTGLGRRFADEGPSEGEIERSQARIGALLGPAAEEGIFSEAEDLAAGAASRASAAEPTPTRGPGLADRPVRPPQVGSIGEGERRRKPGPPPGPRPWEGLGISRATYWRRKKEGGV